MTAFELVLSSFYNMLGFHNVEQSISRVLFNLFMQLFYARKCIFMPKYSVPEIIQQDILQHNQRLRQFISPSVQLQHIRYKYSEKDKMHYIETKFINKKDETNKLKFKCFNSTSLYDEKGDLKNIGNQFKRIFVQSPFNVFQHRCTSDDYFYAYFPKYDKTKKGRECTYIEVGLVNGEMSSFISFTLFFEKDLVTRFDHAYSPPGFPMKNLLMFGCRFLPSLTITFPDKKHFAVQELLSPGYAWRSLLLETRFHPKYQQPDVAEKLFKIAGIPGVDKNTSTRLVELFITINKKNVNPDLPTYIDFMIQEFAHFLSDCNKSLCTIADHTNWEAFIAHFNAVKPLGFTESDLNTIGKGLLKLDK